MYNPVGPQLQMLPPVAYISLKLPQCLSFMSACTLTPTEPSVLMEHNLNFGRLCKLEKWLNGAEILVCGAHPSYLSNKTIFTQNKFMVSDL